MVQNQMGNTFSDFIGAVLGQLLLICSYMIIGWYSPGDEKIDIVS